VLRLSDVPVASQDTFLKRLGDLGEPIRRGSRRLLFYPMKVFDVTKPQQGGVILDITIPR